MFLNHLIVIAFFASCINLLATDKRLPPPETVAHHLDQILFEKGFNQCQLSLIEPIITEDFEFYHDIAGTQDKQQFMQAMKNNICSIKTAKPIRKLVTDSLQVFPLKNNGKLYGIIQQGEHEFFLQESNASLRKTSIAKFTNLWILENDQWQLKRALSFDHQKPE